MNTIWARIRNKMGIAHGYSTLFVGELIRIDSIISDLTW